jgi:tetratricopeptide (TPR) repeat protein
MAGGDAQPTTVSWLDWVDGSAPAPLGGTTQRRYVLLEPLGAGGMGMVQAAYDRELDRKVALKFLRSDHLSPGGAAQLRREAQAMARLRHPHVVTVHDVGQMEDGTFFVAMELVEGQTLRGWMSNRRSWREVRDVFLQAGSGLQAAHGAGLVHRDFKPDNVLIGRDGRVRVADFGLARDADGGGSAEGSQAARPAGTAPYIAPERYLRDAADPRADQFSFCVALHEALYGLPPFAGDSPEALGEAKREGKLQRIPDAIEVPGWLRALVLRGLAANPEARFPNMAALLLALSSHRRRRARRLVLAATGAAAALLAALALAQAQHARALVCRGAERKLVGVWDAASRSGVRSSFAAVGLPYAGRAAEQVVGALDRYTAELVAAHTDACEATQLRREQSPAVEDLRMACLHERLAATGSLVRLLGKADARTVEGAASAVAGLPAIAECSDVAALQAPLARPTDPAARARIDELRAHLAEAEAFRRLARHAEALTVADRALTEAHALGYEPVEAEAELEVGLAREGLGAPPVAEQHYRAAVALAEASHHDLVLARAATSLIYDVGVSEAREAEGRWWATLASAAVQRAKAGPLAESEVQRSLAELDFEGLRYADADRHLDRALSLFQAGEHRDPFAEVRLLTVRGKVAMGRGRADEAIQAHLRAIAVLEATLPGHPYLARIYAEQATVLYDLGRFEESIEASSRALAVTEAANGPDHPAMAGRLATEAQTLLLIGRTEEGLRMLARARAIYQKTYGEGHPRTLYARIINGWALSSVGRVEEGRREIQDVIPRMRAAVAPDNGFLADTLIMAADTDLRAGRPRDARREVEEALAILTKGSAPEDPILAQPLTLLADAQVAQGAAADALAHAQRAERISRKAYGDHHIQVADAAGMVGHAWLAQGRRAEAREALERSVAIFDSFPATPALGAASRFWLAVTLGSGERARKLAERAHADLEKTGMNPPLQRQVERWLQARRRGDAQDLARATN